MQKESKSGLVTEESMRFRYQTKQYSGRVFQILENWKFGKGFSVTVVIK